MSTQTEVLLYSGNEFTGFNKGIIVPLYKAGQIPKAPEFRSVAEYDGIMIEFLSDDPKARLFIDHFYKDEEVTLVPGDKEIIAPLRNSEINPSPAYYSIKVHCADGIFETFYLVEGKHLDWAHIRSMRDFLESRVNGLAYDLLRKRSGMWDGETDNNSEWFGTYKRLLKHASTLRHQLELILENPIESIEKVYLPTMTSRHPDRVSQRWLERRGMTRSINEAVHHYESTISLSLNNKENIWLVSFLYDVRRKVKNVLSRFTDSDHLKEATLHELKQKIEKQEKELEQLTSLSIAHTFKKKVKVQQEYLLSLKKEQQKKASEFEAFKKGKQDLEKLYAYLCRVLTETWLSSIDRSVVLTRPTLKLQKDSRYGVLLKIKRILADDVRRESSNRKQVYPYQKTEKLLEVYVVCILCEIIQSLKWEWTDGWIGGFESEPPTFKELNSGQEIIFYKNGYKMVMTYEPKLERIVSQKHDGFEATGHNFPDILLAIYNESDEFAKAIIIEVKHRHYRYLIHPTQSTDVMEQLKGYTHIVYYSDGGDKIIRDAIDRVICVYPKQERGKEQELYYGNMIRFFQIQPCSDASEAPFGYDYLYCEIEDFCRSNMPN